MHIIQTKPDKTQIERNNIMISKLYSLIETIKQHNKLLNISFFCGKEIIEEKNIKIEYEGQIIETLYILTVYINSDRFEMRAMTYLMDEKYTVRVGESAYNDNKYPKWWNEDCVKIQYGIATFEEAKELSRKWLSDVIEKYEQE